MTEEIREGCYEDKYGRWHENRRDAPDRRRTPQAKGHGEHERRKMYRRKADRELYEKDHRAMIEEALEDFASEHDGHV